MEEEKENVLWKLSYLSDSDDGGYNQIIIDQDFELCDSPTTLMDFKEDYPPEAEVADDRAAELSPIPEGITPVILTQNSITKRSKDNEHMEEDIPVDDDRGISPIPGTSEILTQNSTTKRSKDNEHMEEDIPVDDDRGISPIPGTSEILTQNSTTKRSKDNEHMEEDIPVDDDRGISPIPGTSEILTQNSTTKRSKDNEHMEEDIPVDDDRGISPITGTSEILTQSSNAESKNDEPYMIGHDGRHSPVPGTSKNVTIQSCDDIEINMDYHHSNNLTNAAAPVRSFYEFPTVMPNPEQNSLLSLNETMNMVVIENSSKPPSCQDVMNSLKLDRTFFDQRNESQKKYATTYSLKSDTENSNAVNLGHDKVKIQWRHDLPLFESSFGSVKNNDPNSNRIVTIKRLEKPPRYTEVLSDWGQNVEKDKKEPFEMLDDEDNLDGNDERLNQTCIRVRQNSEDSLGSELTLSPPTSPLNNSNNHSEDDGFINSSFDQKKSKDHQKVKVNPKLQHLSQKKRDPMLVSGQTLSSAESGAMENTLKGVTESNEFYNLTIVSVEVFVKSRQKLLPDPEFDPLTAIFYAVTHDSPKQNTYGILVLDDEFIEGKPNLLEKSGSHFKGQISIVQTEYELLDLFVEVVQNAGADILVGYDTQRSSWGWICRRAIHINNDLASKLSRLRSGNNESRFAGHNGASDMDSELTIAGRILLNIWRLMRSELTLTQYSFENVMHKIFKKRLPKFSHQTLTKFWCSNHTRWMVVDYFCQRVVGNVKILDKLDIIGRTSELAKLFGIQFLEVLTRGSQYRVESIMLRLVRAKNFVPVSPTVQQRAKMKAPEYLPLVMEPESRFYNDPVIVLDFQSLYPSIIMAYNYCYSTCLGRIVDYMKSGELNTPFEFGCTHLKISPKRLAKLEGHLNFSPGGIAFLNESVRKGILPKMLQEILDTRVMVKNSMKLHGRSSQANNSRLQKILHSRQLGLKLIANVTYGYTSANFSGRMPCIEVGDSVVSKGRETLERAIKIIEAIDDQGRPRWPGAKVVYGDTDSVFVLLSGASKSQAFDIGEEMAKAVTQDNPKPVKLKFEKVYLPCILQTKKRYVGYMYESRDQEKPVYDAKGIETVRRDGIPAVVKMLEKCLRILFETKNASLVKHYIQNQLWKISSGRVSLQELIFAKEFRGLHGYRPGACVPALELTRKAMKLDRMNIPNVGQRVPYVIIFGEPGKPLIQSVRTPEDVLLAKWNSEGQVTNQRPNTVYYITKVIIPALSRCLSLIGADVLCWYQDMPKAKTIPRIVSFKVNDNDNQETGAVKSKGVIPHYFVARQCPICLQRIQNLGIRHSSPICNECLENPSKVVTKLSFWIQVWEERLSQHDQACRQCHPTYDLCRSLDCPRLYLRTEAKYEASQVEAANEILQLF